MLQEIAEGAWLFETGTAGPELAMSFGVHGDESPPIDAGRLLVSKLENGEITPTCGRLLLIWGNPRATAEDRRWSDGGVDLNRCFAAETLARSPACYEQERAREISHLLERISPQALVDFHCTVEPGDPFLMQHPVADHEPSRAVTRLLAGRVVLADPNLNFGGVSLDEWMATRGRVGVCYETGWLRSPQCTPESVLDEMLNVLAGHDMLAGQTATIHDDKTWLQLDLVIDCEGEGFAWEDGIGHNLQALAAGTALGRYADGTQAMLPIDATLIFPKKKPELVEVGKPLVYLGVRR